MSTFTTVDAYIQVQEPGKKEFRTTLRFPIKDVFSGVKESIKWVQPVYEDKHSPFCYMRAYKNHITIGL